MALSYVKKGYGSAYPAMAKGGMVKKEKAEGAMCMKKGGQVKKKPMVKKAKKDK